MDQPQQPQPASSPVPAPSFTPSEQNPIVIDHKHRPILGGAFLIIALALSILAGRLLFANYWPNTDEPMVVTTQTPTASVAGVPADWKTYTNTQYGFEFKYPVNLELYEKKQSTFVSLIIDTPELINQIKRIEEGPGGGAPLPTFLLTVSYDPDGKLRVESKCPTLEDGKSSTATQVTIGGVQALQCVDLARVAHNSERGPWLTTTFRNGSYHLWFASGNYSGNEKQTYDQILSTFKFTNSDASNETTKVEVFFGRTGDGTAECDETGSVVRIISKTVSVGTAALEELLRGPTTEEKGIGYTTSIPSGSKLNSLVIINGEARADFNATTESGGGSCSMAARTNQITRTLLQFPTVKTVKLSIDGRTEDIFQP